MEVRISISREGQIIGEFTPEEIAEFFVNGELNPERLLPTDHYWMDGMPEWNLVTELAEQLNIPKIPESLKLNKATRRKVPVVLVLGGLVAVAVAVAVVFVYAPGKGSKEISSTTKEHSKNEEPLDKGKGHPVDSKAVSKEISSITEEYSKNEEPLDKGKDHPVDSKVNNKIIKKEDQSKIYPLIIKPIIDPLITKP